MLRSSSWLMVAPLWTLWFFAAADAEFAFYYFTLLFSLKATIFSTACQFVVVLAASSANGGLNVGRNGDA